MEIQPKMTKCTCTGRMRPKCNQAMSFGRMSGQASRSDVPSAISTPMFNITMAEKKKCFAAVPSGKSLRVRKFWFIATSIQSI